MPNKKKPRIEKEKQRQHIRTTENKRKKIGKNIKTISVIMNPVLVIEYIFLTHFLKELPQMIDINMKNNLELKSYKEEQEQTDKIGWLILITLLNTAFTILAGVATFLKLFQ